MIKQNPDYCTRPILCKQCYLFIFFCTGKPNTQQPNGENHEE